MPDGAGFRALLDLVAEVLLGRPAYSMAAGGRHAMAADTTVTALPAKAGRSHEETMPKPPPDGPRHAVDDTHV